MPNFSTFFHQYYERDCEWRGGLNDINDHLDGCQFEGVKKAVPILRAIVFERYAA